MYPTSNQRIREMIAVCIKILLSKEELSKTDSKELTMRFFDPADKEYENIEMIIKLNIDNIPHSKN